ncbi:MAG: hypothetical protein ACPH3M_10280, partial [Candidatus Puniceispirillales bacterium]
NQPPDSLWRYPEHAWLKTLLPLQFPHFIEKTSIADTSLSNLSDFIFEINPVFGDTYNRVRSCAVEQKRLRVL